MLTEKILEIGTGDFREIIVQNGDSDGFNDMGTVRKRHWHKIRIK